MCVFKKGLRGRGLIRKKNLKIFFFMECYQFNRKCKKLVCMKYWVFKLCFSVCYFFGLEKVQIMTNWLTHQVKLATLLWKLGELYFSVENDVIFKLKVCLQLAKKNKKQLLHYTLPISARMSNSIREITVHFSTKIFNSKRLKTIQLDFSRNFESLKFEKLELSKMYC